MAGAATGYPEAVLLHRGDGTGYGFFYKNAADFSRAIDSFSKPILRSFKGEPIPNQPDPQDHLRTAIAQLLGQAFDRTVARAAGPEAVSWAAAAFVRNALGNAIPRVVVIERLDGHPVARPGTEYLRHPGHPMAVVVDSGPHGGEAQFFTSGEEFRRTAEREPDARTWLPQIVFRLYSRTPSVIAGRPLRDTKSGRTGVECRSLNFGVDTPLVERAPKS